MDTHRDKLRGPEAVVRRRARESLLADLAEAARRRTRRGFRLRPPVSMPVPVDIKTRA